MKGIITKGIGGLYTVMADGEKFECSVRGKFRQKDMMTPLVGDRVEINKVDDELYAIDEIYERKNELVRPSVANIDTLIITFASARPKPDLYLVDKLTAAAIDRSIEPVICITKSDIKAPGEYRKIYEDAGFLTVVTGDDAFDESVFDEITKGKVTALAGCSGVGKSTLINRISGLDSLLTSSVSKKTERGRHTTRHIELLTLKNGGWILDTPGFSSYEPEITGRVSDCFRELSRFGACRFSDCTHMTEPDCAVLKALSEGKIAQSRYESYKKIISAQKEKY